MYKRISILKTAFLYGLLTTSIISCTESTGKNLGSASTSMEENKLPVDVIEAKELELNQEEILVGTIIPIQEVAVVSEISQKISKIVFRNGDYVKKDQLLYKLNDADLRARLKELNAELKLASLNEQRYLSLLSTETIRQQEYDEVNTKLQSLRAQLEFLNVQISKTEIRAPFSGIIGITKVDVGAYVYPGLHLVDLQDQSKVRINFSVPEKYLLQVRKGKTITFNTQLSNMEYEATIVAGNSGLDNQNRSLTVEAIAENRKNEFKGGMSAKINFSTLDEGTKGIRIPSQALIPSEHGYSVFLMKDDRATITPVTIKNRTENEVTVLTGINDSDKVIVSNILRLGEGTPVVEIIETN